MKLDYKASVAVIESPEKNGSSIGKATRNHSLTTIENSKAEEENSCDRSKTFKVMTGIFENRSEIVGKNLAKSPEANSWFRSIFYDKPMTKGVWKLKLENTSDKEFEAVLASWKDAVK